MDPTEALFEQVYEAYGPSLYRFCLLQMKNPADAEDVLQDVLIKRLYQAPRFKSPEHERNWLFQAALNLCRDERRRPMRSRLGPAGRRRGERVSSFRQRSQDRTRQRSLDSSRWPSRDSPQWLSRARYRSRSRNKPRPGR